METKYFAFCEVLESKENNEGFKSFSTYRAPLHHVIGSSPINWPIGSGAHVKSVEDRWTWLPNWGPMLTVFSLTLTFFFFFAIKSLTVTET